MAAQITTPYYQVDSHTGKMNQSLSSIEKLLKASKDLEIPSTKKELRTLIVDDTVRKDTWRGIHEQFGFLTGRLRGTDMWTWYGKYGPTDLQLFVLWHFEFFRKNLYAKKESAWNAVEYGMKFKTYFRITDGKQFLESILGLIDQIKRTETVTYADSKCREAVDGMINSAIKTYGKTTFEISFPIKDYLEAKIPYYSEFLKNEGTEIMKISFFKGIISFTLRQNAASPAGSVLEPFVFNPKSGKLTRGHQSYTFKKGKNTHDCVNAMFRYDKDEVVDLIDLVDAVFGEGSCERSDREDLEKSIRNGLGYANGKIEETFGEKEFFKVKDKACRRRF